MGLQRKGLTSLCRIFTWRLQLQKTCLFHHTNGKQLSSNSHNSITPLHIQIEKHKQQEDKTALVDVYGNHSYGDLIHSSNKLADVLSDVLGNDYDKTKGARISYLCDNNSSYVVSMLATWKIGGICVPLCKTHPVPEIKYFIEDSGCNCIITDEKHADKVKTLAQEQNIHHIVLAESDHVRWDSDSIKSVENGDIHSSWSKRLDADMNRLQGNEFENEGAVIIYTSGTTGRPKGVLHTHGSLSAQVMGMVSAWEWTINDTILHVLPLHHIHGVVNALHVPLHVGATCVMLPKFDPEEVWSQLVDLSMPGKTSVNVFMAVPTIYAKLLEYAEKNYYSSYIQSFIKASASQKVRLMVSGSAALPEPIMTRWERLTGHTLVERYGMTELGMVLTNPIRGPKHPGCVGVPFPGVHVRIAEQDPKASLGYHVLAEGDENETVVDGGNVPVEGELLVKGANMFNCYWNKPDDTDKAHTSDGWFKTGDRVSYSDGVYSIRGRISVDILKSGAYKISALDVEKFLLEHPDISEVVVIGLPDLTWGQKVTAIVVLKSKEFSFTLIELRKWASKYMPDYQMPTVLKIVDEIPKNAMGKVNKKDLAKKMFPKESSLPM